MNDTPTDYLIGMCVCVWGFFLVHSYVPVSQSYWSGDYWIGQSVQSQFNFHKTYSIIDNRHKKNKQQKHPQKRRYREIIVWFSFEWYKHSFANNLFIKIWMLSVFLGSINELMNEWKKNEEIKLIGYKISGTVDDLLQFYIKKKYLSAAILMMLHFFNEYFCFILALFFSLSIRLKREGKKSRQRRWFSVKCKIHLL